MTNNDEIDIGQLFRLIGNSFKNFGNSILTGFARLRRTFLGYKVFFSIAIISGLIVTSTYYSILRKPKYTSSMILSCDYLNKRVVDNSIEKLNNLSLEKDKTGLAEVLKIDANLAKNILKFSARSFVSEDERIEVERLKEQMNNLAADKKDLVNKVVGKIEIGNQRSFLLEVNVLDPDIVTTLDTAIVNYFKQNDYVQKRIESNRLSLQNRKEKLLRESRKLDSLKSVLMANFETMAKQSREGSNNVILSDKYLTDPLGVFTQDLAINNEIRNIDYQLQVRSDFEVVDGLTTFREPSNLSLPILLTIAFFGSIVLAYISIGLWKFNQYLAKLA